MKHFSQEPSIYEAERDFAAAGNFKHYVIISYKPHIPQLWTEVFADSNTRVLVQFSSPK